MTFLTSWLTFHIGLIVKVTKQYNKWCWISKQGYTKALGKVTVCSIVVATVYNECNELDLKQNVNKRLLSSEYFVMIIFIYFIHCFQHCTTYVWGLWILTLYFNMKPARPWMLAHLKIIWQFHAHPVHQKVSSLFGPRYIGDDFFLGPNLVLFNRAVVPLFELSFLTKSQKLTSA